MICVSVANINFDNLKSQISTFEMLELRLDCLDFTEEQYREIFAFKKPTIATYRYGTKDDNFRIASLKKAIEQGADYVDIEIDASGYFVSEMINIAKQNNCKIILSFHDFKATPTKDILNEIIKKAEKLEADFVKIATMANSRKDVARILSLYEDNTNLIAFNMGELGRISRLSSLCLGAEFTYASLSNSNTTASGQYTYKELIELKKKL